MPGHSCSRDSSALSDPSFKGAACSAYVPQLLSNRIGRDEVVLRLRGWLAGWMPLAVRIVWMLRGNPAPFQQAGTEEVTQPFSVSGRGRPLKPELGHSHFRSKAVRRPLDSFRCLAAWPCGTGQVGVPLDARGALWHAGVDAGEGAAFPLGPSHQCRTYELRPIIAPDCQRFSGPFADRIQGSGTPNWRRKIDLDAQERNDRRPSQI